MKLFTDDGILLVIKVNLLVILNKVLPHYAILGKAIIHSDRWEMDSEILA